MVSVRDPLGLGKRTLTDLDNHGDPEITPTPDPHRGRDAGDCRPGPDLQSLLTGPGVNPHFKGLDRRRTHPGRSCRGRATLQGVQEKTK